MGKTFNASVDWLGMVENPDQDADPSVNGGKAQTGEEIIQGGMLPEVEVSALTDESYNKLSQPQQNLYDSFVTPDGIAQTVDIGNDRQMHWKDALKMTDDLGIRNIYNEPNLLAKMNPKAFSYLEEKNDFRPHASPIIKNIHVPKLIRPDDPLYHDWAKVMIDDLKLGEEYWVKQMSEQERLDKIKTLRKSVEDTYRTKYFKDIIAEFAHIPEFWRSESFYNIPKSFMNDAMRFIQGKEMDHSRYHDKDHYEYKTHNAPDSFEEQLREKYKMQDGGSLPKAQFGWNDFEESKIGKFVDAKGLRRDGEHMMNTIGDYFGYENTAEDARRMGLDASAMVNPLPDFINAADHYNQGEYTDAALYATFGILPFSAGPLVKGTKKAFNYLKNTNPLGKNARIAKELSETLDAAKLRNTASKVDKKIIPFEKTNSEKLHKISGKDIKESLDNEAFVNQAKIFNSPDKLPLTRVLDSKGLTIKDGKLFSKTGDQFINPNYTQSRNTTHWSYGHIGNPHGYGSWSSKSTAIINDFDNLKKSGHAMDLDPTDTYFYTKGDFEIPSNSLILTRDKKLYNKIKKESNITNIKLFENTPNDEFEAIVNSYGTKGPEKYNYQKDLFNKYIHKNWEQGMDVAQYKPARYFRNKGIRDHFGGGSSKMHSVDPTFNIEKIKGLGYGKNHGLYSEIETWPGMRDFGKGIGSLDALLEFPKPMQIFEMDKFLRLYKNKPEALKIQKQLAKMNGFKSYKEFKESVDMTNFKKYGGQLQKAQDGTETERQKYIQFALDTESGYHYIRNKDSAVKKLGSDGKWDGKTYYKIYEDGKYYPHYVGDEKRATIGHGHAPNDRDIYEEYKDGINETQALDLLGEDIDEKLRLSEIYYNQRFGDNKWDNLTESEQFMLNDYTFNVRGGFHKTFKNFAKAIHDKDFKSAKKEYKRALGERNVIFMDRYLKPWMDIQQEKTTVAPPLNEMVLPTGTHLMDMTKPQKKETSWWRGEEGWIPDELELPWFMDGAPINARGSSSSSATEIPDGSAAENATMSRSAMDPMPSLNNDLTINDNLALSNTISDLSEETTIAKYGGQYMWGLDLRSTKAQAGKEVKSDDIYANDRYSQSAAKYKKMLPKYQNEGQVNYRSSVPKTDNYTLVAPTLPEVEVVGKDTRNWLKRNYQDYISPIGHGALDVLGMIPAAGELADGINAAWYAAEGNKVDAALSTAAMIPFAGWAATTGKWGKNTIKALNKATPGGGDMYLQMKRINDIGKADVSVKHGYQYNRAKNLGVPQSNSKIKKMIKKDPEKAQKLIDTWNTKYGSWTPNRELVDGKIQLLPGGKTDAISSRANFLDNVKLRVSDDAISGLNYFGSRSGLPGVHADNLLSYTSKLGNDGTTTLYRYGESPFNVRGLGNDFSSHSKSGWFSADPLDPFRYDDFRGLGKDGKVFKIDLENQLLNDIYRGGPQQGSMFNSGTQFKEFDVPDWMIEISNKTDLGSLSDYKKYLKTLKKYGGQK